MRGTEMPEVRQEWASVNGVHLRPGDRATEIKEAGMTKGVGDLMDLIKEGKIEEVRAWVEAQKGKIKSAPDTIDVAKGKPARFARKGKPVACGEEGNWRPKQKR
jgi:hypothetical protein